MRIGFFFLLLFTVFSNAQNQIGTGKYEAIYKVTFLKDTLNSSSIRNEYLSLLIGDNISVFKSTKKVLNDSLSNIEFENAINNPKDGKVIFNFSKVPKVLFKSEVYKNEDQIIIFKSHIKLIYSFAVENKLLWKIGNETKLINNYVCRKATTNYEGRNYIAWFAESITIPEGPYIFKGLPGLIMELYDTKNYFYFVLEGFKEIAKPMILKDQNVAIKTDYSNFSRIRKEYINDPVGVLQTQTGYNLPPKVRESVINNVKSSNNYID